MHDVVVVGAGPIGLFIAGALSKRGFDVHVFEEHSEIGNPWHCSGLFSTHIFDITGNLAMLHPAKRASIIAPSGESLNIGDDKIHGYVVDRVEFDRALARRAIGAGAELHLKSRVKRIEGNVIKANEEHRFRLIIGADGINSTVRRHIGGEPPHVMGAVQAMVPHEADDLEKVTIWVGDSVAPGFFAWLIPVDEHIAKVGLGSRVHAYEYLKKLLKKLRVQPLSVNGGGIPVTQVQKTWSENAMIVGDAAGHVKATSGGGVYPGLTAAQCAVQAAVDYLEHGTSLKSYETCWRKKIGKELKVATHLHRIYTGMSDADFNQLIHDLNSEEIVSIINRYGDIDYPSRVAWRIFRRKPSLLKYTKFAAKQKKF